MSFDFYQRLFTLSVSFGFHGLPLLMILIDQLELRGLDLGKVTSFTHKLIISQAPQAENMWCMRQFVYIENCMGKSPIVKKLRK